MCAAMNDLPEATGIEAIDLSVPRFTDCLDLRDLTALRLTARGGPPGAGSGGGAQHAGPGQDHPGHRNSRQGDGRRPGRTGH